MTQRHKGPGSQCEGQNHRRANSPEEDEPARLPGPRPPPPVVLRSHTW